MDGKAQVIVGQHVRPQATDLQEVGRGLDEVEASTGRLPEKMTWDNGYYSGPNLQEVSEREVQAYIATEKGEKKAKAVAVRVHFPQEFSTHSLPILADVDWDGQRLGEVAEAIAYCDRGGCSSRFSGGLITGGSSRFGIRPISLT